MGRADDDGVVVGSGGGDVVVIIIVGHVVGFLWRGHGGPAHGRVRANTETIILTAHNYRLLPSVRRLYGRVHDVDRSRHQVAVAREQLVLCYLMQKRAPAFRPKVFSALFRIFLPV